METYDQGAGAITLLAIIDTVCANGFHHITPRFNQKARIIFSTMDNASNNNGGNAHDNHHE